MQCCARTATWKRCSRIVPCLFCSDHKRQAIKVVVTFIVSSLLLTVVLSLYVDQAKQVVMAWLAGPPKPLEFRIVSTAVDLPQKSDSALSLNEINNRRLHLLEIRNPNPGAVSDLQIATQFPEAILAISAGEKPSNYKVDSAENWDKQQITVAGDAIKNLTVEPLPSDERTGLWTILIDTIAPQSSATVQLLTTLGEEGKLYSQGTRAAQDRKNADEIIWLLDARYQLKSDSTVLPLQFIVSLEFDEQNRAVKAVGPVRIPTEVGRVQIKQGRGVRIPEILTTRRYLVTKGRNGTAYTAPIMFESLDIDARFGLFGSLPEKPGLKVEMRQQGKLGLDQR